MRFLVITNLMLFKPNENKFTDKVLEADHPVFIVSTASKLIFRSPVDKEIDNKAKDFY